MVTNTGLNDNNGIIPTLPAPSQSLNFRRIWTSGDLLGRDVSEPRFLNAVQLKTPLNFRMFNKTSCLFTQSNVP
jgi:hypothetical protein